MENENKIHHQQDQDMTIQELNTNLLIKIMQFLYLDDGMRLCMTSSLFLEANKHTSCLWKLDQIPPRLLFDYNKNEEQKEKFLRWVDNHTCNSNITIAPRSFKLLFTSEMVREKFHISCAQHNLATCFASWLHTDDNDGANDSDLEDFANFDY